jgi:ABC-2 type transport system permease protein
MMQVNMRALQMLVYREILRFVRARSRWIGALGTPLLFWLLIGSGMGQSFSATGQKGGYFEYFFPGAVALSVLFTAIFSTMSVIEDRAHGFLQGVLVSPVSRLTIVLAKILGGSLLGLLQGSLLMSLSYFAGYSMGLWQWALALILLLLMASVLTTLGFVFAWKINSIQGYHGIMNVILMPMWILSGAVFPIEKASFVLKWIGRVNPLSYGLSSFRGVLEGTPQLWPILGAVLVQIVALAALTYLALFLMGERRARVAT